MNEPQPTIDPHSLKVERIVGVFVLVAVLLLITGFGYYLYKVAERKGWRVQRAPYFTRLNTAEGLNLGDPVVMMGFTVGEITTIEAEPPGSDKKVFIGFEVREPYYGYIWSDSKVKLTTAGLLGARRIEITPGVAGEPTVYEENGRISELLMGSGKRKPIAEVKKGARLMPDEEASLSDRAEKLLSQVEAALPNILAITNRLNATLDNASVLLTNSSVLMANLNQTVLHLQPVISNAAIVTATLRNPHGALGEWILPTDLHTNLNNSIETLTTGLGETLMNVAAITSNLNVQVQSNNQMLGSISKTVVDTDDLVQGLKRHWLLRGIFKKENQATNTVLPKLQGAK